jgi:hypothetical protein
MADFLDKKQDVISFELTKYGRGLLGLGKLQPEYVSFFDDDIIYDLGHVGLSEEQNNSKQRIIYDSFSLKSLNNLEDTLLYPLGKSSVSTDYAPTWNIKVLHGSQELLTNSSSYYKKEFNLTDTYYSLELQENNILNMQGGVVSEFELDNGAIVKIKDDYILLDIGELNNDDDIQNFEIEIHEEEYGGKILNQLKFIEKPTNIINGIIYDEDELPSRFRNINVKSDDVSYFLDILVDDEIDRQLIEPVAKTIEEEIKGTYRSTFSGPVKDDC